MAATGATRHLRHNTTRIYLESMATLGQSNLCKDEKRRGQREEARAWLAAFNDFNLLILAGTAIAGIIFFALRIFGYDVSAFF